MPDTDDTIIDFITGEPRPNAGAEANRQAVERLLVGAKGYEKEQIEVDASITVDWSSGFKECGS